MASTITLTGDWLINIGSRNQTYGTGNLGTYATNGVAISASQVGLGVIDSLIVDPAGGYTFEYVKATGKVKAYVSGATTPAGTIVSTSTKPTFSVESSGAIGTNMEVGLSVDTAGATFEGGTGITAQRVLTTTSPVGTPTLTSTFTGTAGTAAALSEVANSTALSGVTFNFRATGR